MNSLTFNEKQSYLFGYLKGNMEGIISVKFPEPSDESDKEWKKLAEFSGTVYDEICLTMQMPNEIDANFKKDIEELEDEVDEIMQVYVKKLDKQLAVKPMRI